MYDKSNLVWIDLEMTGLDPSQHLIIEIATIVTNVHLEILAEGPVLAIHQPELALSSMGAWCQRQHGQSGLTERVRQSQIGLRDAEKLTLDFLSQYVPAGLSPMCGNSICQDRRFLAIGMPNLERFFHYRHLDVSTLKILATQWKPSIMDHFTKKSTHLAIDDVRDSIAELRYYREHFLKLD